MAISKIASTRQEPFPIKNWVGWRIGWLTGWYNPFDRLGDLVDPRELGTVVKIQGDFLAEHARLMGEEAKMVQKLGATIDTLNRG